MQNLLKDLFNYYFLRKRIKTVGHYIEFLDDNPKVSFEMSIYKGNIQEIVVARQELYKDFLKNKVVNNDSYIVIASFEEAGRSDEYSKRFNNSKYFDRSLPLNIARDNNRVAILLNRNNQELFDTIKFLIEEVYCHDRHTNIQISFTVIDDKARPRLLSQFIGDNSLS